MNRQIPKPIKPSSGDIENITKTAKNIGLGVLAVGATYFIGKKIIKEFKKNRSEINFSTEASQAVALRGAMNRSGMSWLHWMDGTNIAELYKVAQSITNIKKVAKEYKNLYSRTLVEGLRKELTPGELRKFNTYLNKQAGKEITTGKQTQEHQVYADGTGKVVVFEKPTKIYEKLTWLPFGSIKKAPEKSYLPFRVTGTESKQISPFQKVMFSEITIRTTEGDYKTVFVQQQGTKLVHPDNLMDYAQYKPLTFTNHDFD